METIKLSIRSPKVNTTKMAITNLFEFTDSELPNYQICEVAVIESEQVGYSIYFNGPNAEEMYRVQFTMLGMDMYATVDFETLYHLVQVFRRGREIVHKYYGAERKPILDKWKAEQMFPALEATFDFSLFDDHLFDDEEIDSVSKDKRTLN